MLVFFAAYSFNLAPLREDVVLDPLRRVEAVTGLDFLLEDGVMTIGTGSEYEILMIVRVTLDYHGAVHQELRDNLLGTGGFVDGSDLLNDLGEAIPDAIREDLYITLAHRCLFVNLTEGTVNEVPKEAGPDQVVLLWYLPLYGEVSYVTYVLF